MKGTGQRRRKALMLTPVLPAHNGNGARKRAALFLDALEKVAAVDIVLLPLFRPDAGQYPLPGRQPTTRLLPPITGVQGDTHYRLLSRLRDRSEMVAAFEFYGRPSIAAPLSAAYEEALFNQLEGRDYDLVHVFRAYASEFALRIVARMARRAGKRPVTTLDVDEDDSGFHSQLARSRATAGDPLRARWHRAESMASRKLIAASAPGFDRVWASSKLESAALARNYGVAARPVPNPAVSLLPLPPRRPEPRQLLFVGAFDHAPNADGIAWYLSRIHPLIGHTGATVTIIGANPPDWLRRAGRRGGVHVQGWVDDLAPYYRRAAATIVPLRIGSGTRIKILESAGFGVPVVSTRIGAEGLDLADGRDLWLADTAAGFASAVETVLRLPGEAGRRAANARAKIIREYDRDRLAKQLASGFGDLLDGGADAPA